MKNQLRHFIIPILLSVSLFANAQIDSGRKTYHISIFAPLYLDSAFDETGNYRYGENFPKFINPGLEFYEGIRLAVDSLQKESVPLAISVYDTRSAKSTLVQILQSSEFQNTDLIIGYVTALELRQLASAALRKNIPFVNANLPNDGNITDNRNLVILNSTLKTHCEGIYKFLQRKYATQPIYVFSKKGVMEDRLKSYFTEIEKNTASVPLKLKFVTLEKGFEQKQFKPYIDSNIQNVFVVASLDDAFAKDFCFQLTPLAKTYPTTVMGMPTWDNISDFSLPLYNGLEIMYSTPFYFNPNDSLVSRVQQYFKTNYYMRPSDMIFRGFETLYHFAKLLQEHGSDLTGHLNEMKYNLFDDFEIAPVLLNKQNINPDYFENKKLYFIKKVDGNVSVVN